MFSNLKKWLLKPYPFPNTIKSKLLISFGVGNFVFLFLLIFKPFELYLLEQTKFLYYTALYGIITTSVLLVNYFIFTKLFKSIFKNENWKIYKMIFFVFEIILFVGISNWYFSEFSSLNKKQDSFSLFYFIVTAFSVGIFPLFIYIYLTEHIINKKYRSIAKNISIIQEQKGNYKEENLSKFITIKGKNKNEILKLSIENLLYFSSEKNYTSVFYLQEGFVKEYLLRASLNSIENQLVDYKFIVRCHKSYIVNTNQVIDIQGNARGYLLKIPVIEFLIPVSRKFPKELLFTLIK